MRLSPLGTRQRFHVREGGSDNVPGASSCLSRPEAYDTKSSARALDLVEMEAGQS